MSTNGLTEAEKKASEHYFGGCPECGNNDGAVNVSSEHWCVCDAHKVKWYVGSNLFSCWQDENEEAWRQNAEMLSRYSTAEPLRTCVSGCDLGAGELTGMSEEDVEDAIREIPF